MNLRFRNFRYDHIFICETSLSFWFAEQAGLWAGWFKIGISDWADLKLKSGFQKVLNEFLEFEVFREVNWRTSYSSSCGQSHICMSQLGHQHQHHVPLILYNVKSIVCLQYLYRRFLSHYSVQVVRVRDGVCGKQASEQWFILITPQCRV